MTAVAEDVIPAPIVFTDAAAEKVAQLIEEEHNPDLKLRVFVQGGGCSLARSGRCSLTWMPARRARVQLDYEWRQLQAPEGSPDARAITEAMADRVVTEVTAIF